MRFSYLLILSAAVLAATHETALAASILDDNKISKGATSDSVVVVESLKPKRLLRSHEESGEERAVNWAAYNKKWVPKVEKWVKEGMLPSTLKKLYKAKSDRGMDALRQHKYDLFNAAFLRKYPGGFNLQGLN